MTVTMTRSVAMRVATNLTICFLTLTTPFIEVEYNELRQGVLSPSSISQLRKDNISYSNVGGVTKNNHEGGDFKLENQIKRIKSLAPKVKISEDIWKKLRRCSTDVSAIIEHGRKLLGLKSHDRIFHRVMSCLDFFWYHNWIKLRNIVQPKKSRNITSEPTNNKRSILFSAWSYTYWTTSNDCAYDVYRWNSNT